MKIVSSTGYGFTGSTAITDLIREYRDVETCKYSGYELKLFHDTKGILNLYHYMVVNRTPAAMNDAATDFLKKCELWAKSGKSMNYELFFNNQFMKYTKQYLDKLGGNCYMDVHDLSGLNSMEMFIYKMVNKSNAIKHSLIYKEPYGQKHIRPIPLFSKTKRNYLFNVNEESFIEITKEYLDNLMKAFTNKTVANIHELIPISLIDNCCRFFDDVYIITTERDPRDIYLNAKYRWLTLDHPSDDVHFFCEHYKWLRSLIPDTQKEEVLKIQFEDLVYNYDATVKRIEDFLGIESSAHAMKKKYFVPEKARLNCNLVKEYENERENIEYIEKELSPWLYNFDSIGAN